MTPHPQRCETCGFCKYDKPTYENICQKLKYRIIPKEQFIINHLGCASHSSAPSEPQCLCETCCMTVEQCRGAQLRQAPPEQDEREKVLDEVFRRCKDEELRNKKRCDDGVDNITSFQLRARQGAFERVCIWIEELRSKQGEP
jgi:hypothetical protein